MAGTSRAMVQAEAVATGALWYTTAMPTQAEVEAGTAAALVSPAEGIRDQDKFIEYRTPAQIREAIALANELTNPESDFLVMCAVPVTL